MPLPELEEFGRRSEQIRRRAALSSQRDDSILPSLSDVAAPALSVVGAVGDILSRPAYGLSEAYGEVEEGEGVTGALEGLLRGVTGGYQEAQHPTFGERAVPEQEDEDFGRKLARFGVDVVTDPLVVFGGPIARGLGKGAVAAGRLAKGSKVGQAAIHSSPMKAITSAVMGTDWALSTYGKTAGRQLRNLTRRGIDRQTGMEAARRTAFMQKMKELGFKSMDDPRWEQVSEVLETGAPAADAAVNGMARHLRHEYDLWQRYLRQFRDFDGQGFKAYDIKTGESLPFEKVVEPNYNPQMLRQDIAQRALTKEGFEREVKRLAKEQGMDESAARSLLEEATNRMKRGRRQKTGPGRAGNIEYIRRGAIPEAIREKNAAKLYDRYLRQATRRTAFAREFGVDHRKLSKLLDDATEAGLPSRTANILEDAIEGRHVESAFADAAPTLLGWQVLTKMGPTSSIAQLAQHSNTIVAKGVGNYVKGLARLGRDPELRQRSLQAVHGSLRRKMQEFLGTSAGASKTSELANAWLKTVQFTRLDEGARKVAFAGGISSAEQAAARALRSGAGLTDELKKMGVTADDLGYFAKAGRFTRNAENRIGIEAANSTQFAPDFLSLPPLWQTPEMRIAMQFRSFIHQQTRFLWRDVMEPAIKYFDTSGKEGSIAPLMRALAAYPIAGQGVAAARELYRNATAKAMGIERDPRYKRKFDYDHPIAQLARDSVYVGAFGLGGDILEQAARGRMLEWVAGPTVTDLVGGFERGVRTGFEAAQGEFPELEDVTTFGARHAPFRRFVPSSPREIGESAADWMRGR